MEEKIILEADVISEKESTVPMIVEPNVTIEKVGEITNNILEVKNSAERLKDYYSSLIISEDNLNLAKSEKANVRKIKEQVADYRKKTVAEFKKPIEEFEELAKETEKILKESYELIDTQCNAFDERKKDEARETLKQYFDELRKVKNISFILYENMNQKVGLSDITSSGNVSKKKYTEIDEYIETIEQDLTTIETMENSNEILVEYMKDRNLARSIAEVQKRHSAIEKVAAEHQDLVVGVDTAAGPDNQVEILSAPVTEEKKKLKGASFRVICTEEKLLKLVEYMKVENIQYEAIKEKNGD